MLHRLLVPLDGSPLAEAVLPTAAFLAQRANARVMLLHLVEHHAPATVHGQRHLTSAAEAESYLADVARRCFPPTANVVWHVHGREIDDVAHGLADQAGELDCDLVVMLLPRSLGFPPLALGKPGGAGRAAGPVADPPAPRGTGGDYSRQLPATPGAAGRTAGARVGLAERHRPGPPLAAPARLLMVVPTLTTLRGEDTAAGQLLPGATREMLDLAQRGDGVSAASTGADAGGRGRGHGRDCPRRAGGDGLGGGPRPEGRSPGPGHSRLRRHRGLAGPAVSASV